jgi:signal transduction histidine kinase
MRLFRPTLRVRMALLYGGLVLLVGVSLLFTCVILLDHAIATQGVFHTKQQLGTQGRNGNFRPLPVASEVADAQNGAIRYLLTTGLIYFGIIVVIGSTGGYLLAKQALRPIAKLTQTARALSTETLDQRISLGGPDDELRELADTFDDMLGRLDAAFDSQRLFVANASHELRTPLSVIRTELEVTLSDPDADPEELRRMGKVVADATERAQRLVTSLLTLARLQAVGGGELEVSEAVDLAWLVPAALHAVAAEADEKRIRIETEIEPAATVGDPRLLERLIGNLVENAIRHNVADGWLRITTGQTADKVWLHVANGGVTIPAEDVDRLFEPFRRGGRMRTSSRGAGLGLAIVRLIVEAHRGRLQAAAPPFGGLAIRVELPREPAGDAAGRARGATEIRMTPALRT